MIRIRVKATHVTIRIDGGPKQRYASAIHVLHVIRVAVVGGATIEETKKTKEALTRLITQARDELNAAIDDVDQAYLDCMHPPDPDNLNPWSSPERAVDIKIARLLGWHGRVARGDHDEPYLIPPGGNTWYLVPRYHNEERERLR